LAGPSPKRPTSEKKLLKEWGPTLLVIVAIYLVLNVALPAVLSTQSPLMVVVSGSMVPTLNPGDIVIVQGRSEYCVDDIVVYKTYRNQKPIVHRIMGIGENGNYVTKGDHNIFSDPGMIAPEEGVGIEDIRGKVVYVIPKLGYPKYLLSRLFSGHG